MTSMTSSSSEVAFAFAILLLGATMLSAVLVPIARHYAIRFDIVDRPGHRKIHQQAKPYLGGLAVYVTFMTVVLCGIAAVLTPGSNRVIHDLLPWVAVQVPYVERVLPSLLAILAGATLVFAVGLWDDVRPSEENFRIKLLVQLLAALLAVASGNTIDAFETPWLNIPITILWIVGITNSFNLLDNMDGLCGGIASIALLILAVLAAVLNQWLVALVSVTLLGSILGFLFYNFYPSKIFLGDAGSLCIGYLVGCISVVQTYVASDINDLGFFVVAVPVLTLAIALFDTVSVIIIRVAAGKPIYIGDRNHLSHRLVAVGFSQRGAVLTLYGIALSLGITAILLPFLPKWGAAVLMLQAGTFVSVVSALLYWALRRGLKNQTGPSQTGPTAPSAVA